jgi:hypothetical protein
MYAEGDSKQLTTESALYLKDALKEMVNRCKIQPQGSSTADTRQIDFSVLGRIFHAEIAKFYRTKRLTKGLAKDQSAERTDGPPGDLQERDDEDADFGSEEEMLSNLNEDGDDDYNSNEEDAEDGKPSKRMKTNDGNAIVVSDLTENKI